MTETASGREAVWIGAESGRGAVVGALVEAGADLNKAGGDGATPL